MERTVVLVESGFSPRAWVRENGAGQDHLILDPGDATFGPPGRVRLLRNEKPVFDRFIGSLDAQKAPHLLIAALVAALDVARGNLIVQLYPYRVTPVLRQLTQTVLEIAKPSRVMNNVGFRGRLGHNSEEFECDKTLPPSVMAAQRKAQWLAMIEHCESHTVDLSETELSGSRLGAGDPLSEARRTKLGLDDAYVEVAGPTLYVVTDREFEDETVSRALDYTHCSRAHFVLPSLYEGVVCSFAKQSGDDFGFGFVRSVDFINLRAQVMCTAIPPVPVPILKLGSFRIDDRGNELGELKPWAI